MVGGLLSLGKVPRFNLQPEGVGRKNGLKLREDKAGRNIQKGPGTAQCRPASQLSLSAEELSV